MFRGDSCVFFHDGITNGAAWKIIGGNMEDWSYVYTSEMEIRIEMGCDKYPKETDLQSLWNANKGALLAFITQVKSRGKKKKKTRRFSSGCPWCSWFRFRSTDENAIGRRHNIDWWTRTYCYNFERWRFLSNSLTWLLHCDRFSSRVKKNRL